MPPLSTVDEGEYKNEFHLSIEKKEHLTRTRGTKWLLQGQRLFNECGHLPDDFYRLIDVHCNELLAQPLTTINPQEYIPINVTAVYTIFGNATTILVTAFALALRPHGRANVLHQP